MKSWLAKTRRPIRSGDSDFDLEHFIRVGRQPPALPGVFRALKMAITFVTTTSHGTWLPGDLRGYVRRGVILPGDPQLLKLSRHRLKSKPVYFARSERRHLFLALVDACSEFGYRLSDVAIETWHLHWILFHGDDRIEKVVGRLKTRMRQALTRGRIWTEGYCAEPLFDNVAVEQVQEYIAWHEGCMMIDGRVVDRANPRQSRGLPASR